MTESNTPAPARRMAFRTVAIAPQSPSNNQPDMTAALFRGRLRQPAFLILMCLLVCGGAWVSTKLSLAVGTVSCIWIANGIISAFILTAPARWKTAFFLVGQLTNVGVDLMLGDALYSACWFAVCNSLEVLVPVLALGHFDGREEITTRPALLKIAWFGILLGPLTCALLAAPAVRILEGKSLLQAARIWFLADALGSAATLPLMLFLLTREKEKTRSLRDRLGDGAWAILLAGSALAVFWQTRYPLIFLLFPPLVAALFRFRLQGAVYGASVVVLLAAAFTAEAHGPFALLATSSPTERVVLFQIFGLTVFGSCVPLGFSIEERNRLEASLKHANRQLGDLALIDPLTGVRNRRSFDSTMECEWSKACASGESLSLLYLDVDFFKRYNDTYGHQTGDDCLRSIGVALIARDPGSENYVARYGGEEFVILLPAASTDLAHTTADLIASTIRDLNIPHKTSPFGVVTGSFGIATARPAEGGSPRDLIRLADDALYIAKRSGRDRIETWRELHAFSTLQHEPQLGVTLCREKEIPAR
jgi:diguanylate cyclase (GGDEF)-like protein